MKDSTTLNAMQVDLNELVEEYLAARDKSGENKQATQLNRIRTKLDSLYWKNVEWLLREKIDPIRETLDFSDDERLIIDMGLLDYRLIEADGPALRQRLLDEISTPGPTGHFYLSEWLEDRYHKFCLTERVNENATSGIMPALGASERQAREKILSKLAPLFKRLPGITPQVAEFMISGQLADQLVDASIALLQSNDRHAFVHRNRLRKLRQQIIRKARTLVSDSATQKLFDVLEDLYAQQWKDTYKVAQSATADPSSSALMRSFDLRMKEKREEYLISEIHFVKTLFPLGALAGGIARTSVVMTDDTPRVTKTDTRHCLELARACDRELIEDPVVLIAPYKGRGFFEWDRDSLVVALHPVDTQADCVANAFANFRMLTDSLQKDGTLRAAYENSFCGKVFQKEFQSDYRLWLTQCGQGRIGGLDSQHISFFMKHVGPNLSEGLIVPQELHGLSVSALELVAKRMEKQVSTASDDPLLRYRLAAVFWVQDKKDDAIRHLAIAAKNAPANSPVMLSLALSLRMTGQEERAQNVFKACRTRAATTIWSLYAAVANKQRHPAASAPTTGEATDES